MELTCTELSDLIMNTITDLDEKSKDLEVRAKAKARLIAKYEKKLAITMECLRSGKDFELTGKNGEKVKMTGSSLGLIEKYAKGICAIDKYHAEFAEARYKNILTEIEIKKTQLNGYQSINRNLDNISSNR